MSEVAWQNDVATESFAATIAEALRIHNKAVMLTERVQACLVVATETARRGGVAHDELCKAAEGLKAMGVPGRGAIGRMAESPAPTGNRVWTKTRGSTYRFPLAPAFVYLLRDKEGVVIYIGYTSKLAQRLASHSDKPWVTADLIGCPSALDAKRLEGDLIFQHQPPLNKADRSRRRYVS